MPTDTTFRAARKALVTAQKPSRSVSAYSSKVNRPIGRSLAAGAFLLRLSPNQVTVISGVVSVVSAASLALFSPSWLLGILVAFGLLLGFALDSADGQLARLQGSSNLAGEWLDHVVDALVKLLLHACVAIAWFRFVDQDDAWLLVPLAFQLVCVLLFFGGTLAEVLLRSRRTGPAHDRPSSRWSTLLLLPVDFGTLGIAFVVWGSPDLFRGVYVVLGVCYLLLLGGLGVKWFVQLKAPLAAAGVTDAAAES
jgi:phosphatidylglycerophosphate synthase